MSSSTKLKNTYAAKQFMKAYNQQLDSLQKRLSKLVEKIAKETVSRVQDYIRINYYEMYPEGDNYERLGMNGGFMGAITYDFDPSGPSATIYFDAFKLVFGHKGSKVLPSHIEAGQHFTQGLYDYMMLGEWPSGKQSNTVAPNFTGLNTYGEMDDAITDWLNDYISDRVWQAMSDSGLYMSKSSFVHVWSNG